VVNGLTEKYAKCNSFRKWMKKNMLLNKKKSTNRFANVVLAEFLAIPFGGFLPSVSPSRALPDALNLIRTQSDTARMLQDQIKIAGDFFIARKRVLDERKTKQENPL
jgi:hypothetical protein